MTSWIKNTLLLLSTIILLLFTVEIVLRLFDYHPFRYSTQKKAIAVDQQHMYKHDPQTGYIIKPGIYHFNFLPDGKYPVTVSIDKNGSRFPLTGTLTHHPYFYFVGGSVCFGIGVTDTQVFSSVISQQTHFGNQNQCVGGYGTLQSLIRLQRAAKNWTADHKPTAIIYAMISHHAWRNVVNANWIIGLDHGNKREHGLQLPYARLDHKKHVKIYPPTIYKAWPFREYSSLINLLESAYVHMTWNPSAKEAFDVTVQLVQKMSGIAKKHHIPFYVVHLYSTDSNFIHYKKRFDQLNIISVQCSDHNYCNNYKQCPQYAVPNDNHPSARVHRYYAQCIIHKIINGNPQLAFFNNKKLGGIRITTTGYTRPR